MKPARVSEFYILDNCDAAYELMRLSGEEPATVYAFKGTKVHRVLAGSGSISELDPDEHKTFEDLWAKFRKQLLLWREGQRIDDVWTEAEFNFHFETRTLFTGHPDKVVRQADRLFIPDFKTGWHPLDAISATNCQLRGYVALTDANIPNINEITVWIDKPGKTDPPALYAREDIDAARRWAFNLVTRATSPEKKQPNRGPWCQYCSGKVLCPLWRDEISQLAKKSTEVDQVEQIPDDQLALLAPKLDIAQKVIERLKARLAARVKENPAAFEGWKFKPGRLLPDIKSVINAWLSFKDVMDSDTFLGATKLGIGELVTIYRDATGTTWEEARKDVEKRLGENLHYSRAKPSLVYEPKALEIVENNQ